MASFEWMSRRRRAFAATGLQERTVAWMLAVAALGASCGAAAELRLRPECRCQGPLVTLGDVADVLEADAERADRLAAVELFPAPPPRQHRYLRLREIQDLLLLRGVNLARHRFSGASQVVVHGQDDLPGDDRPVRPASSSETRRAQRRVREAVTQYLQAHAGEEAQRALWTVEPELEPGHLRALADPRHRISIAGGSPPWPGQQRFQVAVDTVDGRLQFPISAQVSSPAEVVVAVNSLRPGTLIRAEDVALEPCDMHESQTAVFHSIDRVIGMETVRSIPQGKVLSAQTVRPPLLVRRGEVVTVYSRGAGVCVRTMARAREDGSLGELITVESLLDRRRYYASVSGVRQVDVYARSAKAGPAATGPSAAPGRPAAALSNRPAATSRLPLQIEDRAAADTPLSAATNRALYVGSAVGRRPRAVRCAGREEIACSNDE